MPPSRRKPVPASDEDEEMEEVEEEEEEVEEEASEADGEEEEDDEDEESEEEVIVEPKVLNRETRGRRIQALLGEAVEEDAQFWGHTTWVDEQDDEEWSTEDEGHYKDIIDSDFDQEESEEEEKEETEEQRRIDNEEKQLKSKNKLKTYQDPRIFRQAKGSKLISKSQKSARKSTQQISNINRPLPPPAAQPRAALPTSSQHNKKDKRRGRVLSQEDHLAIAAKTELENTKHLNAMIDHENWKKALREQKQSSALWHGQMELHITWSSERIIDSEQKKPSDQIEEPYCRDMLFFMDFDQPANSCIPPMYRRSASSKVRTRPCSVFPDRVAKYRDPFSGEFYSDMKAFKEIRRRHQLESSARISNRLRTLDTRLKNVLHFLGSYSLLPFSEAETCELMDTAASMELPEEDLPERKDSDSTQLTQTSPATSDAESNRTPILSNGRKDPKKRLKQSPPLPSPKRQKHAPSPTLPIPDGPGGADAAERHARKTNRRNDRSRASMADMLQDPSLDRSMHDKPLMEIPMDYSIQQRPPRFPIRRQPLRIRSTANTFYQQSAMTGFPMQMFGDPYSGGAPFASPMMMGNRTMPFMSAPNPGSSLGTPLDMSLLSLGGFPPFGLPNCGDGFSPFFPPQDANAQMHQMSYEPYFPSMGAPNPFRPMGMPIPHPRMPQFNPPSLPLASSGGPPVGQPLSYSRPSDDEWREPLDPSQSDPNSSPPSNQSVYCYPSPSLLPPQRPAPDIRQERPDNYLCDPAWLPPGAANQHAGVVIRPAGPRGG